MQTMIRRTIAAVAAATLLFLFAVMIADNRRFIVRRYTVRTDKLRRAYRFVYLSDLHQKVYPGGNEAITAAVRKEKPDFIILDPPRDVCTPKALDRIISYGVPYMVYISCKPTSLARDLVTLQARGYKVLKACCVDEFPNTEHVETVCLLNNKFVKAKDFVQIGIDAEDYYKIKDAE